MAKNQNEKLSNTLRLNFCYLKIIRFIHPRCHPKNIKKYSKKCAKTSVSVLIKKMKINVKYRLHRCDINKLRPRHGHKYTKYRVSVR